MWDYRASWTCSCGAMNAEPRRGGVCRKCGTAREEAMIRLSIAHKRKKILEETKAVEDLEKTLEQRRTIRQGGVHVVLDWICVPCGTFNYGARSRCRKCDAPPIWSAVNTAPVVRQPDRADPVVVKGYSSHSWLGKLDATMTFHMGRLFPVPDIERL